MPLDTAIPSVWRISAPTPWAIASGTTPQDKGERSHQNRSQPQPAGFQHGLAERHAGLLLLHGEFDDRSGVFAGQADCLGR
jgi:hypothetical protein